MNSSFSPDWLLKGYFNLSEQDKNNTTTRLIRDELCVLLGLPSKGLRISTYPTGVAWRHTFWWREGDLDYAEAQLFAQISQTYPALSLGVSVEKGVENPAASRRPEQMMNRNTWDWPRLVQNTAAVLAAVADTAAATRSPINLRTRTRSFLDQGVRAWQVRCFSFVGDGWFERHVGVSDAAEITEHITELDDQKDNWTTVHLAYDLAPGDVADLSPAGAARMLAGFNPIRLILRP